MKKLAIALQGSFGHSFYALGIIDTLRGRVNFCAGSGCVEMMGPLLLLFAPDKSITSYFLSYYSLQNLLVPKIKGDIDFIGHLFRSVQSYQKWTNTNLKLAREIGSVFLEPARLTTLSGWSRTSENTYLSWLDSSEQLTNLFSDLLPRYQSVFGRSFMENKGPELDELFRAVEKPVFTNAVNAETFREVYLHAGISDNDELLQEIRGEDNKRDVYELKAERFFASGARAPFFDPITVEIEGENQRWMEGAMRCNPPLHPLIDAGADQILLIRFFSKSKRVPLPQTFPESIDRYLETVFTAPLEKEIETIASVSKNGKNKKPVQVFDPADQKSEMYCEELEDLVDNKLTFSSHFKSFNPVYFWPMYRQGQQIGKQILQSLTASGSEAVTCYE